MIIFPPAPPNAGKYEIGYVDPPWRFEVWDRDSGLEKSPDKHYPTMTVEDMAQIPVSGWMADDALLALWTYDPISPIKWCWLAEQWGFAEYVTCLFRWVKMSSAQWDLFREKLNYGTGYHTRGGGIEECRLFRRGKGCSVLRHDIRKEFYAPVREHSRKPDEVPGWIVDLYGDRARLEMFARMPHNGFDAWGNDTTKFKVAE